jgi:hypothetical protein
MAPDNSLLLALGLIESANAVGIAPRTLRKAASEGAIPSVKGRSQAGLQSCRFRGIFGPEHTERSHRQCSGGVRHRAEESTTGRVGQDGAFAMPVPVKVELESRPERNSPNVTYSTHRPVAPAAVVATHLRRARDLAADLTAALTAAAASIRPQQGRLAALAAFRNFEPIARNQQQRFAQ